MKRARSSLLSVFVLLLATNAVAAVLGQRASLIRTFSNRWLGTPYRWGGDSRTGIDCSAYLRELYRELFHIELPRTTRQQIDLGVDLDINPMNPSEGLEPGDLIFYIDRVGVPNHVVVYMGNGQITHSVSGRGVVVDPMSKLWGRRVIARRFLVPSRQGDLSAYDPVPPAGPMVPREIPCPPSVRADRREVKRYESQAIDDLRAFGDRDICDFRALAGALRKTKTRLAEQNAARLEGHAEWLESIDALKGEIGRGW